jgi:hypothetical protein
MGSPHTMSAGTTLTVSRASRPDWEKKERVRHNIPHRHYRLGIGVTLNVAEWMVLDCCLYVLRDEEQVYLPCRALGTFFLGTHQSAHT